MLTAKKRHTCCECGDQIASGERYIVISVLNRECDTRAWETYKTCLLCNHIAFDLLGGKYILGELKVAIEYCLGFDYTDDPSKIDDEHAPLS
jgi:hypothetical protein